MHSVLDRSGLGLSERKRRKGFWGKVLHRRPTTSSVTASRPCIDIFNFAKAVKTIVSFSSKRTGRRIVSYLLRVCSWFLSYKYLEKLSIQAK